MTTPVRFPYADITASRAEGSLLAYLPITLRHGTHVVTVPGLLETGSTVNVLPYSLGLQLGLVWEQQPTQVHLTESLARLPPGDRLRPSGLVSADRTRVCMDPIDSGASDPATSELVYGIRCMLFPIASGV
jgi:hypothetical protein